MEYKRGREGLRAECKRGGKLRVRKEKGVGRVEKREGKSRRRLKEKVEDVRIMEVKGGLTVEKGGGLRFRNGVNVGRKGHG